MKTLSKTLMLATAGMAMVAAQAQAQSFTYADGDLLLDFRQASSPTTDLTIDLGAVSSYAGQTSVVSLNQFSTYLTGTYGANLSGLDWSVAGSASTGLWMTRTRNAGSGSYNDQSVNASTPWINHSGSVNALTVADVRGTGNGAASVTATVLANQVATTSDTANNSYHHFVGNNGNWSGNFQGNVETATGASFTGSAFEREDLYASPNGSGNSTYLGYFELDANSGLEFVPATLAVAVPEPMTYGLLSGIGLLALSLRQQIRRLRV